MKPPHVPHDESDDRDRDRDSGTLSGGTLPRLDSLDPTQYVAHVTRTVLLLERLAQDVRALRDQTDAAIRNTDSLRTTVSEVRQDAAVFKVSTASSIEVNRETIREIDEKLRWLSRLVIGALITAVVGGLVAYLARLMG